MPDTDLNVVASILDFGQLRELAVMVYHHLGQKFLYDMYQLASRTPSNLTRIEVFSLGDTVAPLAPNTRLIDTFKPLLGRRSLQNVTLVLSGYRFNFCPLDLLIFARSWPDLRHLNLSFSLLNYATLPNLAYSLPAICQLCPRLEFLHVPALATTFATGPFHIPTFPNSVIEHISSDIALFKHSPLDIAWSLQHAFPRLKQVGAPSDDSTGWQEVSDNVRALKDEDYATIFEHIAKSIRAGAYHPLP